MFSGLHALWQNYIYLGSKSKTVGLHSPLLQTCPGLNANEMHVPHDRHHKVSSLIKFHQNTPNSVKYEDRSNMEMSNNQVKHEVLIKQYLRSILDISAILRPLGLSGSRKHPFGSLSTFEAQFLIK